MSKLTEIGYERVNWAWGSAADALGLSLIPGSMFRKRKMTGDIDGFSVEVTEWSKGTGEAARGGTRFTVAHQLIPRVRMGADRRLVRLLSRYRSAPELAEGLAVHPEDAQRLRPDGAAALIKLGDVAASSRVKVEEGKLTVDTPSINDAPTLQAIVRQVVAAAKLLIG